METMARCVGWMMWREGKPHSFAIDLTKEDLLISYDLIPLRGLEATEKHLAARGLVAYLTEVAVVAEEERCCYGVTVRGELVPEMLAWPVCAEAQSDVKARAAGYLASHGSLSGAERRDLGSYWLFGKQMAESKRGQRKLAKLRETVDAVLVREQIEVCPLAFWPLGECGWSGGSAA